MVEDETAPSWEEAEKVALKLLPWIPSDTLHCHWVPAMLSLLL